MFLQNKNNNVPKYVHVATADAVKFIANDIAGAVAVVAVAVLRVPDATDCLPFPHIRRYNGTTLGVILFGQRPRETR